MKRSSTWSIRFVSQTDWSTCKVYDSTSSKFITSHLSHEICCFIKIWILGLHKIPVHISQELSSETNITTKNEEYVYVQVSSSMYCKCELSKLLPPVFLIISARRILWTTKLKDVNDTLNNFCRIMGRHSVFGSTRWQEDVDPMEYWLSDLTNSRMSTDI